MRYFPHDDEGSNDNDRDGIRQQSINALKQALAKAQTPKLKAAIQRALETKMNEIPVKECEIVFDEEGGR